VNTVVLIGSVASDVEVREVARDKRVARFTLAVERPGAGAPDLVPVTTWDRQAATCETLLERGRTVGIGGRLRERRWEDAKGGRRSALEVVASTVELLPSPEE
jgi:single-strand DNA-binding protein